MNTLKNNWQHLLPVIEKLYVAKGVKHDHIREDLQYLEKAYFEIEAFWDKAFDEIKEVKLILFGEAPMYGAEKSYFYNPATPHTSFFYYNDAAEIVDVLTESECPLAGGRIPKKVEMLQRLNQAGVLIVDIFPFCLNPKSTALNYTKIKESYTNLFANTLEYHFDCKLRAILPKTTQSTQFAFRYEKFKELEFESETLCAVNEIMNGSLRSIDSIGRQGGPMDRNKLRDLYTTSIST